MPVKTGIEEIWTWQVDTDSALLSLGFLQGQMFWLFLDAGILCVKLHILSLNSSTFAADGWNREHIVYFRSLLLGWVYSLYFPNILPLSHEFLSF